ncbi:MAG TPA: lamin tail domain-containing protein [Kiritimatiellia bacterium]|mgnify:CR=1 FL=1|nr:lamin tail domain-containing protein [Kiritimatiellia bacterium]
MKKWLVGLVGVGLLAAAAVDALGGLIISQYYEGAGNDKWIEIYNPGDTSVDLLAGGYRLGQWSNAAREAWKTNGVPGGTVVLSNSIAAGGTYLVKNTTATNPTYAVANQASGSLTFNGDDSVVLYTGATFNFANVVDAFGMSVAFSNAADRSYVRTNTVTTGVYTDFNAAEWIQFSTNAVMNALDGTRERLGYHFTGGEPPPASTNVKFYASSVAVNEDQGTVTVTILKTLAEGDVSGQIVLSGTATEGAGADYVVDTTNFTMNGATTSATVTVTINNDEDEEPAETVVMDFANVVGAGTTAPATFTLTINANDAPPPVAEGIVDFRFNAAPYLQVTAKDDNLAVSDMALSAGTIETAITTGTYFTDEPYIEETGGWAVDNQAGAKAFQFTITPAEGASVTIDGISFKAYATSAGPSAFGFDIGGGMATYEVNAPDSALLIVSQAVAGVVGQTGTIAVKIQGWANGSRATTGAGVFRLDDVVIHGSVSTGPVAFGVTLNRANGFTVTQGTSNTITATAANGTPPYGYSWTSTLGEGFRTADNNQFTILATAPTGSYSATVTATDNAAQSASNTVTFTVVPAPVNYAITITPATNGTVSTTPATQATAGTTVTIQTTPAGGYALDTLTVTDAALNPVSVTLPAKTFVMPAADVIVTATFKVQEAANGELIISQYYEGTSNNKWIEIYNPGSAAIDLAAGAYRLGRWDNANREAWKAGIAPSGSVALSNSIPAGGTYLIGNTSATNPAYAVAGQLSGVLTFTGDDSVVLYTGSTYAFANVVDAFGMTATNAMDRSFVRKTSVTAGVNADFNAAEWDEFSLGAVDAAAESTNERLGYHSIGASALGVSLDRTNGFTVAHGTSAAITATATGGTAPYGYSWTSTLGEGYRTAADNVFTILATAPAGDYTATVTATDGAAQTASNTVSFTVLGGGGETWQIGNPDTGGGMFYSTSNQTIMIVLPTNYTLSAVYGTDSSGAGLNNLGQGLGSPLTPGVDYNWNPATRTISVLSGVTNRRVLRIGASSP